MQQQLRQKFLPPTMFLLCLMVSGALGLTVTHPSLAWPWRLAGIPLVVAGVLLAILGSRQFERLRTNINTFHDPNTLVTDGVFRISRNPMYLGFAVTLLGVCILLGSPAALVGWFAFIVTCQFWYIPFEEQRCEAAFGDSYRAYLAHTRRWI